MPARPVWRTRLPLYIAAALLLTCGATFPPTGLLPVPMLTAVSAPVPSDAGAADAAAPEAPKILADGYTSAEVCAECHHDIYRSWTNSLHGNSLTDPIFELEYMRAITEHGDDIRHVCLRCHAPITTHNKDYFLREEVTQEGVTCDFCHTVKAVELDNAEHPYVMEPGLVKRSVLKRADSPAHEVAYSKLHDTSEFCAGCHNYTNRNGLMVLSTYYEWSKGPMPKEGIQCQDCHMSLGEGSVVDERIKKSRDRIHRHSLIHDASQLVDAVSVTIKTLSRKVGRLYAEVELENIGSGHMIPTGMPNREVVLVVTVEYGSRSQSQERRFRRVIGDAQGKPYNRDYQALLLGEKVLSDNRLAPREPRLERFWFNVPPGERAKVNAHLVYKYPTWVQHFQTISIDLGTAERTLP